MSLSIEDRQILTALTLEQRDNNGWARAVKVADRLIAAGVPVSRHSMGQKLTSLQRRGHVASRRARAHNPRDRVLLWQCVDDTRKESDGIALAVDRGLITTGVASGLSEMASHQILDAWADAERRARCATNALHVEHGGPLEGCARCAAVLAGDV